MHADARRCPDSLTEQVIAAIFEVSNTLGVELKCVDRLTNEHTAQCLNYLKASGSNLCLSVNFQKPTAEWKRIVNGFES
jgi:hypothetical protein